MTSKKIPLENGYTAEFDAIDERKWYEIIDHFDDSNIYQTWSYDAIRHGEKNLSHLVLRSSSRIVAAAQTIIVRLPLLGLGAAYIRWGPLWHIRNEKTDNTIFRMAIRSMRNEYVCTRGLVLRIYPLMYKTDSNLFYEMLHAEGFRPTPEESLQRTLILDIQPPIEEIRKNFKQKWRNCLNRAERNQLELIKGTEDNFFEEFIGIYRDLLERKKFKEPNDINEFRMIQRELPNRFKMGIFLCRTDGLSSAGAICTAIGDTGVYLFGATNDQGMKNKGSYLIQWKAIQWMKKNGCNYYNLNGINPKVNPGSYHFKAGISGKNGNDVQYLGRFDCYSGAITAALAKSADVVFPFIKRILSYFRLHN